MPQRLTTWPYKLCSALLAVVLAASQAQAQVEIINLQSQPYDLVGIEKIKTTPPEDCSVFWSILQPLNKNFRVIDQADKSEIVFVGAPTGETVLVEADVIDFVKRSRQKSWYYVTSGQPGPTPPTPPGPIPPTPPAPPDVPNQLGLGHEVYRLVMAIPADNRKRYAAAVADLWESEAAQLVAIAERTVAHAAAAINAGQVALIQQDRAQWNAYGQFVSARLKQLEQDGKVQRSDKASYGVAFREIASALRAAGVQP